MRTVLIVLPVLGLLAVPSLAAADTFCVQPESSCAGPNTFATVQGALDAANGNGAGVRDMVLLGAATYTENPSDAGGNPVDIVGKGTGQTTIASSGGTGGTTFTIGEPSSTISALAIRIGPGNNNNGLDTTGLATGIAVTEPAGNPGGGFGVKLSSSGATLSGSTVTVGGGSGATYSFNGGTIRDSQLSGAGGFQGFGTIRRSRLTSIGAATIIQGPSTIENSLLRAAAGSGGGFSGVSAFTGFSSFNVDLRNDTIAGDGGGAGVNLNSSQIISQAPALSANVTNTIIRGLGTDLEADVSDDTFNPGVPTAQITVQSSDFDPAKTTTSGGGQINIGPGNINADPLFVDPVDGDFGLTTNSPAVDRGDNGFAPSGPDLAGAQRVADGDEDGQAVVDMGPLEFSRQTTVLAPSAITVPAVADPGEPVAFIADASDSGGAPLTYSWSFDDGRSGAGDVEIHSFQTPGTHTGTVTVRNPSGNQASASASVQIRGPAKPVVAAEQCAGRSATQTGTSANDVIHGTAGADVIVAGAGNDKVIAGKGADVVCGGDGKDTLKGGQGRDRLFGEQGRDELFGGPGHDRLEGGSGKDREVP